MLSSHDIPVLQPIMDATGIEDVWFLLAIIFFVVCVILAAALINSNVKKRRFKREVEELKEYSTGLEAMTHLPPLKGHSPDGGDSLVFTSVKELKRQEMANEDTQEFPKVGDSSEEPPENLTAAVHDAILASVLKPEGKAAAVSSPSLSGRIPKI